MKRSPLSFASLCLALTLSAATTQAAEAQSGRFLGNVLYVTPAYQASLRAIIRLEPKLPVWVRNILPQQAFVSLASQKVEVDGQSLEVFDACRPADCPRSQLRLIFTPDGKTAWGLVRDAEFGEIPLGKPSPAMLEILRKPAGRI